MKFSKSKDQNSLFDFVDRGQEFSGRVGSMDRLKELIDFEVFRSKLMEFLDYCDHEQGEYPRWESAPPHTSETLHFHTHPC